MSRGFTIVLLSLLLTGCGSTSFVPEVNQTLRPGTGFITQSATLNGHEKKYTVFLPEAYSPSRSWPTILFIHGFLAGGSDGVLPVSQGLGKYISEHPKDFPFIVLFPQSPRGPWNNKVDRDDAVALLQHAKTLYSIDADRVSLVAVSTGAYGGWKIAADHTDEFAALVTFSGQSALIDPNKLTTLPVRSYHYSTDPLVGSYHSASMVDQINRAGGDAKLTKVSGIGHYVWEEIYSDGFFQWLMDQRRSDRQTTAAVEKGKTGAPPRPAGQ